MPHTAPELLEPSVSESVIDEVYEEIRAMQRGAGVDLAIRMGKLIVEKFYRGDLSKWHETGQKDASLRTLATRLAEDGDPGLSAASLHRAIGIYELERRFGVSDRQLGVTHLRALIGLPEERQRKLLALAEEKRWKADRLEKEAGKARKVVGDGRGRPPLPAFVKTWHRFHSLLADKDAFDDLDAEVVSELKDQEAEKLRQAVTAMKAKCEELEKALAKRKPTAAR